MVFTGSRAGPPGEPTRAATPSQVPCSTAGLAVSVAAMRARRCSIVCHGGGRSLCARRAGLRSLDTGQRCRRHCRARRSHSRADGAVAPGRWQQHRLASAWPCRDRSRVFEHTCYVLRSCSTVQQRHCTYSCSAAGITAAIAVIPVVPHLHAVPAARPPPSKPRPQPRPLPCSPSLAVPARPQWRLQRRHNGDDAARA
jgi:hypothetical protein